MDLKRDYSAHGRREKPASNSSLFQEYQYFTPGASHGPNLDLDDVQTNIRRYFHGIHGVFLVPGHPLHWSQRSPESAGTLCRV